MKKIVLTLVSLFYLAVSAGAQVSVQVRGSMSKIMRKGDLTSAVGLDTLAKKHLYALGPVAGLKGEIMVINGTVHATARSADTLQNTPRAQQAAMLVYSYVSQWRTMEKQVSISGIEELETLVERVAAESGVDTAQAFAFLIEGKARQVRFHVIDWKKEVEHTFDNHKQFAIHRNEEEKDLLLLGFYSKRHHSIFTHHTSNVHLHVLIKSTGTVGHLDNIVLTGAVTLSFPEK